MERLLQADSSQQQLGAANSEQKQSGEPKGTPPRRSDAIAPRNGKPSDSQEQSSRDEVNCSRDPAGDEQLGELRAADGAAAVRVRRLELGALREHKSARLDPVSGTQQASDEDHAAQAARVGRAEGARRMPHKQHTAKGAGKTKNSARHRSPAAH